MEIASALKFDFFFSEKGNPQSSSPYLTFRKYAKMRKLVSHTIGGNLQCIDKNLLDVTWQMRYCLHQLGSKL